MPGCPVGSPNIKNTREFLHNVAFRNIGEYMLCYLGSLEHTAHNVCVFVCVLSFYPSVCQPVCLPNVDSNRRQSRLTARGWTV